MSLVLTSPAFTHQGEIPAKYTADGEDTSPPLEWMDLPAGTRSLALVVEDPDVPDPRAPTRTWVHWVVFDIPPELTGLHEGAGRDRLPPGARHGLNDWKRPDYGGPNPPLGRHRYVHTLYALDRALADLETPTARQLEQAMAGHVLERAQLVGTWQKRPQPSARR